MFVARQWLFRKRATQTIHIIIIHTILFCSFYLVLNIMYLCDFEFISREGLEEYELCLSHECRISELLSCR